MQAALKAARAIADQAKAEGRDMTQEEITAAEAHLKTYQDEKDRESTEIKSALKAAGVHLGLGDDDELPAGAYERSGSKTGRGLKWAESAVNGIQSMASRIGTAGGVKALISGSISVPNLIGDPVQILALRTTLLDLVGRGTPQGDRAGNGFQYIRQTARENNASAVADGAPKPTSVYTFGEVDDTYRVYANKTEDLPYRYLSDYTTITDIVRVQLAEDTLLAIEADILSGDGTGDAFTGILNTSGIQTQPWNTDLLRTLSDAKHKFIAQELPFTGWVFNPDDLQTLELMREGGTTGAFLFPSRKAIEDFLGAPVVTSIGMPAGHTVVGDWDQAEVIPLGDDELVVDTGKRTVNNTFLFMFEGRYGFRVKKPVAFVDVDLTSA